jgi:hypothetical protein
LDVLLVLILLAYLSTYHLPKGDIKPISLLACSLHMYLVITDCIL